MCVNIFAHWAVYVPKILCGPPACPSQICPFFPLRHPVSIYKDIVTKAEDAVAPLYNPAAPVTPHTGACDLNGLKWWALLYVFLMISPHTSHQKNVSLPQQVQVVHNLPLNFKPLFYCNIPSKCWMCCLKCKTSPLSVFERCYTAF